MRKPTIITITGPQGGYKSSLATLIADHVEKVFGDRPFIYHEGDPQHTKSAVEEELKKERPFHIYIKQTS